MCDRCQRVPVFGMNMSECPSDVREVNAAGDPGVLIDVARIVVVNEIVPERLCKYHLCNYYKGHANAMSVQRDFNLRLVIWSTIAIAKNRMANHSPMLIAHHRLLAHFCFVIFILGGSFVDQNITA